MATKETKQNCKTINFWDEFYTDLKEACLVEHQTSDGSELEWIVSDKLILVDKISSLFPKTELSQMCLLEIGCGVSLLSRSLLERMLRQDEEGKSYDFVSTDVSLVCLDANRARDAAFIGSLPENASLSYAQLNVVKEVPPCHLHKYHVILEKGTLDTFLFRSKRTQKGSEAHAPLLKRLLNNVHRMLRSDCKAKYIIISPRPKLKSVRDFVGFASVNRIRMSTDALGGTVLVKNNSERNLVDRKPAFIFIYECTRNDFYDPGSDEPFLDRGLTKIDDGSVCGKCHTTFKDFHGKVDIEDQGVLQWTRRFRNHTIHCTGDCLKKSAGSPLTQNNNC